MKRDSFRQAGVSSSAKGSRIFKIHPDPSESVWSDDGDFPDLRVMELYTDWKSDLSSQTRLAVSCPGV